jgi:hypothetical protein
LNNLKKERTKMKRVIIATLSGIIFGVICNLLASGSGSLPWPITIQIITSRTLIGFAIGISSLKIVHVSTIVMGIIYGLLIELITSVIFKAKQK